MTSSNKCQAKNPELCVDPNCPEKRFSNSVFSPDSISANVLSEEELKVYIKYRHFLRAQSKKGNAYAPVKRQAARELTVNNFDIPYAEVKRIVAKGDLIHEISHEKPKPPTFPFRPETISTPLSEIEVGNRVLGFWGLDARVIKINGLSFTFKGVRGGVNSSEEWVSELRDDDELPIVVEEKDSKL